MAEKRQFQAIKGTRDLLPPETELWSRVEQTAHEVFGTFGFGEIRLPIFEPTELFARAVGGETDIVFERDVHAWDSTRLNLLNFGRCDNIVVLSQSRKRFSFHSFSRQFVLAAGTRSRSVASQRHPKTSAPCRRLTTSSSC